MLHQTALAVGGVVARKRLGFFFLRWKVTIAQAPKWEGERRSEQERATLEKSALDRFSEESFVFYKKNNLFVSLQDILVLQSAP